MTKPLDHAPDGVERRGPVMGPAIPVLRIDSVTLYPGTLDQGESCLDYVAPQPGKPWAIGRRSARLNHISNPSLLERAVRWQLGPDQLPKSVDPKTLPSAGLVFWPTQRSNSRQVGFAVQGFVDPRNHDWQIRLTRDYQRLGAAEPRLYALMERHELEYGDTVALVRTPKGISGSGVRLGWTVVSITLGGPPKSGRGSRKTVTTPPVNQPAVKGESTSFEVQVPRTGHYLSAQAVLQGVLNPELPLTPQAQRPSRLDQWAFSLVAHLAADLTEMAHDAAGDLLKGLGIIDPDRSWGDWGRSAVFGVLDRLVRREVNGYSLEQFLGHPRNHYFPTASFKNHQGIRLLARDLHQRGVIDNHRLVEFGHRLQSAGGQVKAMGGHGR